MRMTLDHETGDMDGDILAGALAGQRFSTLALPALSALYGELGASSSSSSSQHAATDASRTNIWQRSEAVALVPSGQNLLARHPGGLPGCARFEKPLHGMFPFRSLGLHGRQMRHNSTVARDGNCRTTFNSTEKVGQVSLRLGGLNLLNHGKDNRLFQPDWIIRL